MPIPGIPDASVNLQPMGGDPRMERPAVFENPVAALTKVVSEFKQMSDAARVAEATNKLEEQRMALTSEYSTQLGASVLPEDGKTFTDKYVGKFKEASSQAAMGLTPHQQAMFNAQATQLGRQFQNSVQTHETQQLYDHAVDTHKNTIAMAVQAAPNSIRDPQALGNLQGRIDGAVTALAQMQGMDENGAKLLALQAHDQFNAAVIGKMMDKTVRDYAGARAYLNAHIGEMTSATASKLDDLLTKRENLSAMTDTVTQVWGDKSLNYDQKVNKLLQHYKDDPETQQASIEQLHLHQQAYKVAQDQSYGNVWDMITGLNPGTEKLNLKQIEATEDWKALDGDQRKTFVSNYRLWLRQLNDTTSPQEDYERCILFNDFVTDPKLLMSRSNDDMRKVAPALGKGYFDQLMDLRSRIINNQSELANVTLDANRINIAATNLGFKPGTKMSLQQAKDLAAFKSQAIQEIAAAQMRLQRKLNDNEQGAILDRLSAEVVVKRKGAMWSFTPDYMQYSKMPVYKAIETLPYPPSQINEARQWLLSQGLEVRPDTIETTINGVFKDPSYRKGQ